jgi:hypothetical protein
MTAVAAVRHDVRVDAERDRISPMTDEEAELFRWLRFGQLPDRIRPSDMIAMVDVEPRRDVPEPVADPTGVWNFRYV